MKAITISNDLLTIGTRSYNAGSYVAEAEGNQIRIIQVNKAGDPVIFDGKVTEVTLNAVSYNTGVLFCAAFNTLAGSAVKKNTDYPDTLISAILTPVQETRITDQAKPGSVVLTTPASNSGVINVGLAGVGEANYALAADKSIPIELKDLSRIFVKNVTATDKVHVIGSYKN